MSAASWIVDKSYMIADNFHKHLFYATANILLSYYVMDVVRQDMDVNEHDELSKFTLTQIKGTTLLLLFYISLQGL